jgi:hypothetical protein
VSEGLQSAATICIEPTAFQAVVVQLDELSGRSSKASAESPGLGSSGEPPRNMAELFRYLDHLSGRADTKYPWDPSPAAPDGTSGMITNLADLYQHLDELSNRAATSADPEVLMRAAETDFDQGRAGAGGIALYKAAELLTPLKLSEVKNATWSDGRLVLQLVDRRIAFPQLDPEYVALALRSVHGSEGTYEGKVVAEEPNAVVIQTGRGQFGEVVWKKAFLSEPWRSAPPGSKVKIELGPGLGLLAELEPSTDRVTYYGPIQNTRMGRVLLESDRVLQVLMYGLDSETGRTVRPDLDGFMTVAERLARKQVASPLKTPAADSRKPDAKSEKRGWWSDLVWLVWIPDRFTLKLAGGGKTFEFVDTRFRLDCWTAGAGEIPEEYTAVTQYVNEHFDRVEKCFPALVDLREVTKAVAVVRWLKQQNVAMDDPRWAVNLQLEKVVTPAAVRRYKMVNVFNVENDALVPVIEPGDAP